MRGKGLPSWVLLVLWAGSVAAWGLRPEPAWLAWAALVWLLAAWSPPDGPALERVDLWWAWLGWVLLSALAAFEPLPSLHVLWRKATVLMFFALAWSWWGRAERRVWVALFFFLSGLAGLVWAWGVLSGRAPAGLFPPNPNYTAAFLAAAAAGALWAGAEREGGWARRAGWFLLCGSFTALMVATRSRGALWALGASAAALGLSTGRRWPVAAGLAALAGLAVWGPPSLVRGLLKVDDPLAYERPLLWETAVRIAMDQPWLGVGPGGFEQGYFLHRQASPGDWAQYSRFATHAHSEPLHLASETGWLGLGFLAWAVAFFVPRGARSPEAACRAASGAFWALLAHGLVDGVLALPALEILFFALMVCGSDWERPPFRFGPPRLAWIGAAGLAFGLATWAPLRRAERLRDEGARAPDGETAAGRLKEALAVHPADSFLRDLLAGVYLMKEPFRPALALAQLDLAIQSSPTHAVFWAQKAELLLRSGDPARAQEAAMRAVSLEPQFGSAHLLLAEAALAQGRPVLARAALDRVGQVRTLARSLRPASAYERLLLDVPLDRLAKVRAALGGPR